MSIYVRDIPHAICKNEMKQLRYIHVDLVRDVSSGFLRQKRVSLVSVKAT